MKARPHALPILSALAWLAAAPAGAQGLPDLAVALTAIPNPVVARGPDDEFEIRVEVQNIKPADTQANRAQSSEPVPLQGADVLSTTIVFDGDLHMFNPRNGLIAWKADPGLRIRDCAASTALGQATRCTIGPLVNGGRWVISFRFHADCCANLPLLGFRVAIDETHLIRERTSGNNGASLTVNFK